jgi:hypothetical protein
VPASPFFDLANLFLREMSYGIMGSTPNTYMLTYQTTRTVQVLYFDGESAALQGLGQLDTQMLHIFGNVTGPIHQNRTFGLFDEYARADGLCDWLFENKLGGVGWGFEGIVRMNAGFELIWCNFSSPSLRLISQLNVTAPQLPPLTTKDDFREAWLRAHGYLTARAEAPPLPLPLSLTRTDKATDLTNLAKPLGWRRGEAAYEPFLKAQGWGCFTSATKHYGSSGLGPRLGESRVRLSSCGILNYYSPEYQSQSLARAKYEQKNLNLTSEGLWLGPKENDRGNRNEALKKLTRRRRKHRLNKIDAKDVALMRSNTERVLSDIVRGNQRQCSGADWYMIMNEMVQVYAIDLMRLQLLLSSSENLQLTKYTAVRDWMYLVRAQNHAFLMPFLQYPLDIKDRTVWEPGSDLAEETFARCKYHHTRLLVPGEGIPLSPEEELLRWAVEETMGAICYVTQAVGFAVEKTWLADFSDEAAFRGTAWRWGGKMQAEARRWTHGVEELMAWLGWAGEWVRCEKACAWDEECYIPMWPLKGPMGRPPRGKRPYRGRLPGEGHPGNGPPEDGPPGDFPPGDGPPEDEPPGEGPGGDRPPKEGLPGRPGPGMEDNADL